MSYALLASVQMLSRNAQQSSQIISSFLMEKTAGERSQVFNLRDNKEADTRIPEWIQVEFAETQPSLDMLEGMLEIQVGFEPIWRIDLSLLKSLQKPKQSQQSPRIWMIPLSMDIFMAKKAFISVASQFTNIHYTMHFLNTPEITSTHLMTTDTLLDNQNRRVISANSHEHSIYTIETKEHAFFQNVDQSREWEESDFTAPLSFGGVSRGYFITGLELSAIQSLTLKVNNTRFWNFTGPVLEMIAEPVSDLCFFISFERGVSYKDITQTTTFHFHQSRMDQISLTIQMATPTPFTIHSLNTNKLRYQNGLVRVTHMHAPISTPIFAGFAERGHVPRLTHGEHVWPPVRTWTSSIRPLDSAKNTECPITSQNLANEEYCLCDECHYQFLGNEAFREHVRHSQKCPMCRRPWIQWILYRQQ